MHKTRTHTHTLTVSAGTCRRIATDAARVAVRLSGQAQGRVPGGQGLGRLLRSDLKNLCRQLHEGLPDIAVALGARLQEDHVVQVGVSLWRGGRREDGAHAAA